MLDGSVDFAEDRRCKDVIWALLFGAVATACVVIFAIAVHFGDPSSLPSAEITNYEAQAVDWATREISILHHDLSIIFAALSCGLILTFVWVQLLKRASLFFMVATVLALALASICLGIYTWNLAYRTNSNFFLLISFLCWTFAAVVLFVSYILRERITFTAEIMQRCGKVLQRIPWLVAVPFVVSVIYLALLGVWLLGFVYLFSIVEVETVETSSSTVYYTFFKQNIRWLFLVQLLGGLWTFSLLSAFEQYVVARVVYACEENHSMPFNSLAVGKKALREMLSTSLGSLAFGSLLSAMAEMLGLFIKYSGVKGKIKIPEFCCLQSLTSFAQYLIQWTNGFSYIYVASQGHSFGHASAQTYRLLQTGFSRIVLASVLVNYLLAVGTLFFTFLVGGTTIALIEHYHYHVGLISVFVTFCSIYLMFHITGRLILITVNTLLVYLFENHRILSQELAEIKDIFDLRRLEETGNVVRI